MHINSLLYGTLTANSGSLAGFPASNLVSSNRANLWIARGNFTIGATNNKLYIGGTTYTLTNASYTAATLVTHINSVIAATGLVLSYTADFKFKWTNGSGSTRVLNLSSSTNAAWDTIGLVGGVDISILAAATTEGEIRIHTSEYLYYDLGYSMDISFFALLPQRNYANMLTSGAVINLKASNVNDISNPTLDVNIAGVLGVNEPGEEATYYFLETDGNPVQYRYVWITIIDRSNPYGPNLVFSQLFLGGYTAFTNRTVDFGFTLTDVDRALRTESQAGGLYFEKYGRHKSINGLRFSNLTNDEAKTARQLFYDVGKSESFYMTLDGGNVHGDIYDYTYYGVLDGDAVISKQRASYFDASFDFRSN
jgi:hypothetical protein